MPNTSRRESGLLRAKVWRSDHHPNNKKNGKANNMRYMMTVPHPTPWRYDSLTMIALPLNAIAPQQPVITPTKADDAWMTYQRKPENGKFM